MTRLAVTIRPPGNSLVGSVPAVSLLQHFDNGGVNRERRPAGAGAGGRVVKKLGKTRSGCGTLKGFVEMGHGEKGRASINGDMELGFLES
nr:hypothetical protein Iba_chr06bCG7000 [Ipomoea batatas]GMD10407.1 hypothetical protein Iba_chr06eCG5990 [Ipomoea batatas]